ncbi:site-specific tyrosine recombinase [Clostridium tarantellae]|uniref:Tyrosine-type recombinase/integrase n=1 Tax=Clostridium tarantellae TaxID=39493 RepID=A0A6I1MIK8_9CLOT|nr:site-specific tyrosine recombinase [Clostridium tarantellae]MPQ42744.1 tyrosine-type recombinase/integrase [Clostridium tarantellae]
MRDLVSKYEVYLESIGKRKNTVSAYITDVSMYLDFVEESNLTVNEEGYPLIAYIQYLKDKKKSPSSIQRTIISLRNFYNFLVAEEVIKKVPELSIRKEKVEKRKPLVLTVDEINKIMNSTNIATEKGVRDKALLEVMYATGMKVSELISLAVDDVDLELSFVRCTDNKGYERLIPIGKEARESLKRYIVVREETSKGTDKLFLNMSGEPITRQGVWRIVKEYSVIASIDKDINLNTFRHSFAVHLLQNGANAKVVQELLGNQVMTYIDMYYEIINSEKINNIYRKAHPRA